MHMLILSSKEKTLATLKLNLNLFKRALFIISRISTTLELLLSANFYNMLRKPMLLLK